MHTLKRSLILTLAAGMALTAAAAGKKAAPADGGMKLATTPVCRVKFTTGGAKHWWQRRFELKAAQAKKDGKDIEIVLLGDSITHFWERNAANRAVFNEFFSRYQVLNLGFSGDRTQHLLWIVEKSGIFSRISPKAVVMMIGTNNTGWKESGPDATFAAIKRAVNSIRKAAPDAQILLFGIFPRGKDSKDPRRTVNDQINRRLPELADGKSVHYLDISSQLLEPDGSLSRKIMPDLLHPGPEGYRIWGNAMQPLLRRILNH